MPTPRESYTNTVERQGFTGARLRPADFGAAGETLARAGQNFGNALGNTSDNLLKIQKQDADTAAQEADNARNVEWQTALAEFQTLQGKAAVDAARDLPKKLDEINRRVAGEVIKDNAWARKTYDEIGERRRADMIAPIVRHTATQRVAWRKEVTQQGFENALNDASAHWDDPKIVDENITTAGNHAVANLMVDGTRDPAAIEAGRRSGQGKAIAQVAKRIELEKGAQAAQAFIKQREDKMDPTDYTDLLTTLAPRAQDEESDQLIDGFVQHVGGLTTDQYYKGDEQGPKLNPPSPEIPDHRETPVDLVAGHVITSGIGHRTAPLKPDGTRGSSNHAGIDLGYRDGTPVPVSLSGIAHVHNQGDKGYGLYVEVDHGNGLTTRYAHLSSTKIKDGDVVKRGDVIALSGHSGGVAPHLHYEARQNGEPIDPRSLNGRQLTVGGHALAQSLSARAVAPAPGEKQIDLEATIAKIKEAGFTPRFEQVMIAKAKERYGLGKQIKADQEDQVRESVAGYLNTLDNPESFTSIDQLPLDIRHSLIDHPELEQGYRRWAQNNADAIQAKIDAKDSKARTEAATQADLEIATMLYARPDAFKKIDFTDPRQVGNLSSADRMKYMGVQSSLEKSDNGSAKTANYDAIRTAVNRFAGKKPPSDVGLAYEEAARREEQWISQHPNQTVPDAVREGIAREVMTKYTLVTPGALWGETRKTVTGYQLPGARAKAKGARVEVDSFEVVKAQLQQIWGRTPTDAEVTAEISKRSTGRGLRL